MNVHILDVAYRHLRDAARFYEQQSPGLGNYFRTSLLEDIERLKITVGAHAVVTVDCTAQFLAGSRSRSIIKSKMTRSGCMQYSIRAAIPNG